MSPALIAGGVPLLVALTLALTNAAPDMVLLGALALLVITGVVSAERALEGFSNEGLATIGALFVMAEGLRRTGATDFVSSTLLRPSSSIPRAQLQLMVPVAVLSAFINNTPVVATMIPHIRAWSRRSRMSASVLLLPMSYASIFGGFLTLVGTSTTLVVNGLLSATPGQRGLGMFEIAWVGLPLALTCIALLPLFGRWLLPSRTPAIGEDTDPREYTLEMNVDTPSPLAGRSIRDAGLRQLNEVFLFEIVRDGHVVPAVGPDTPLREGDRLVFVGIVDSVIELRRIRGLSPATDHVFNLRDPSAKRCIVEVVLSSAAPFLGTTIRESQFRTRYQATVIAVSRHAARVRKKPGDIRLEPGDTLLIETLPSFVQLHRHAPEFLLVHELDEHLQSTSPRTIVSQAILLGVIALAATEQMTILQAASLGGVLMVLTRCLRLSQIRSAIDWSVIVAVGAGIGLGAALEDTGAAETLSKVSVGIVGSHPYTNLLTIAIATMLLANVMTTKAAAIFMFPVALAVSNHLQVDFMPFAVTLIISAGSALATPVGHQTNLMVYGPGGYRSADFLRLGGALSLVVLAIIALVVPRVWPFRPY